MGLKVLEELVEEELRALVGPKGKHNPERTAVRHGSRSGQVVLGGRKVQVRRPRARSLEVGELPLRTYAHFASDDLLSERTVETMLELYPKVVDSGCEREGGVPSSVDRNRDAGEAGKEGTPCPRMAPASYSFQSSGSSFRPIWTSSRVRERDEQGRRLVVRNGRGKERRVTVGSGTIALRAPRVDDRREDPETGERRRFSSAILPRYARRSPKVTDVLPLLYRAASRPETSGPPCASCSGRAPRASRPARSRG